MSAALAVILPSDLEVVEAARLAAAAHLHLITDGRRTCLSPIVPPGWFRLGVHLRTPAPETAPWPACA